MSPVRVLTAVRALCDGCIDVSVTTAGASCYPSLTLASKLGQYCPNAARPDDRLFRSAVARTKPLQHWFTR